MNEVPEAETVTVRRQWNDWRTATLRVEDLYDLHFTSFSGGISVASPRPFLHGYCSCHAFIDGEVAHSCIHGSAPHWIKVCVVQMDNSKAAYKRLAAKAQGV